MADGDNDINSDSDDDSEDDVRGAVATTDDDCDEVSSYLSKGSGGAMDQIDELMRKASRETPTPPMDQTGRPFSRVLKNHVAIINKLCP